MKRKILTIIVTVVCIISISFYYKNYSIKNNKTDIQNKLEQWFADKEEISANIIIYKTIDIDNKKIVLYKIINKNNQEIGEAELIGGKNGRYKICRTGHGTNEIRNHILKTKKAQYLVLMGKNFKKIAYIKIFIGNIQFNTDILGEEYFIKVFPLPNNISSKSVNKIILYDSNNDMIETFEKL